MNYKVSFEIDKTEEISPALFADAMEAFLYTLASGKISDGELIIILPARYCKYCSNKIPRKSSESEEKYQLREYCGKRCCGLDSGKISVGRGNNSKKKIWPMEAY